MAKQMEITLVAPSAAEIKQIAPREKFENLTFWKELTEREKNIVVEEGQELVRAKIVGAMSALAEGRAFAAIHKSLEPKKLFAPFVRQCTNHSVKQAYRLKNKFENASLHFSPPVLKYLEANNITLCGDNPDKPFGPYTETIKIVEGGSLTGRIGPGPDASQKDVEEWVKKKVLSFHRERKAVARKKGVKLVDASETKVTPNEALLNSYRFVIKQMKRSSMSSARKVEFTKDLAGMILKKLGVSGTHVHAVAVPEDFEPRPVGRPTAKAN